VVTSGPYKVVRHPMYAGAILLLIFTPIALGSWVALPFPLPLIVVVAIRAVEEENSCGSACLLCRLLPESPLPPGTLRLVTT